MGSSSQSHYRQYEASEAKDSRSRPRHVKPALEVSPKAPSAVLARAGQLLSSRTQEDFPDWASASAVTVKSSEPGKKELPLPLRQRRFDAISAYDSFNKQMAE